jgi:hypothetical protein
MSENQGSFHCLILSGEFIPGELLLSRARFRFNSPMQNSKRLTIFTTCQKKRPLTKQCGLVVSNVMLLILDIKKHSEECVKDHFI